MLCKVVIMLMFVVCGYAENNVTNPTARDIIPNYAQKLPLVNVSYYVCGK